MGLFDIVKDVAMTAVECLPVVGTAISAVKTGVALAKGDYKGAAMEAIGLLPFGKIASKVGKVASKIAPKFLTKGGAKLAGALNKFAGTKVGKALGVAADLEGAAAKAIIKGLKKIINSPRVAAGLKRVFKKTGVKTAASGIQKIAEGAKDLLKNKMNNLKNKIKQKLQGVKNMTKSGGKAGQGSGSSQGSGGSQGQSSVGTGNNNNKKKVKGDVSNTKKVTNNDTKKKTETTNTKKTEKPKQTETTDTKKAEKETEVTNTKKAEVEKDKETTQKKENETNCKDPINVVTGSFDVESVDLVVEDIGIEINIERTYDSRDTSIGVMGRGWSFNYETRILREDDELIIVSPHGDYETYIKENETWTNIIKTDKRKILKEYENKYELIIKNKVTYTYDKDGKLISIADINNNTTKLEYIDDQIKTLTSPGGKKLHFTYKNKKITKIVDNINRELNYRYDGDNLVEVDFPNEGTVVYEYENNLIVSVTDQNDIKYVKNKYDMLGRVVKQTNRIGEVIDIKYNEKERETTFTVKDTGRIERYKYNEKDLMTEKIYKNGVSEKCTYNKNEIKDSFTDGNGNKTKWIYDDNGNLIKEILPNGIITNNTYDEKSNLIKKKTEGGKEVSFSYDEKGNLIKEKIKLSEKDYAEILHTYDKKGRLTSTTNPEGNIIKYYYEREDLNKPTEIEDGEGNIYRYEYDKAGRNTLIKTNYGQVEFYHNALNKRTHIIDAKGNTTRILYNKLGLPIKRIKPKNYIYENDNGVGYQYRYDMFDRPVREINQLNSVKAKKYDADGNLIKEIDENHYDPVLDDGLGTEYIYDDANRKIKDIYPNGGIRRTKHDSAGNITKIITPNNYDESLDNGKGLHYEYDKLNRLTLIKDIDGVVVRKFIYDLDGNLIKEIDAKGYAAGDTDEKRFGTLYKYNLAGWLTEKRVPVDKKDNKVLYNITKYEYNKNGDKLRESKSSEYVEENTLPSKWNHIDYIYDRNNRIINIKDATGGEISYTYDCLNNRLSEKIKINDEKTKVTRYKYDSTGKLEKLIKYIDGEDIKDSKGKKELALTTYEYDKNGNIKKISTPEGKTTDIYYDDLDRIKQVTEGGKDELGRITMFSYDKVGNLIKEVDCNNNVVEYKYDDMNRLIEVKNEEGSIRKAIYDKEGNIIKTIEPEEYHKNGEKGKGTSYTYDSLNRIKEIQNALGVIVKKNIYNASNEVVEEIQALDRKINYSYDIGGRRREVSLYNKGEKISQQYSYDSQGNITGLKDSEGNETNFKLDLWGRIKEVEKADKTLEKYTYDYAGNVTSTTDGEGKVLGYEYNSLNKLSKRIDQEGNAEILKYDKEERLASYLDRNGNDINYSYNLDGKVTKREETKSKLFEEYFYNKDGTLKSSSNGSDIYTYDYTKTKRLKGKSVNGQRVLDYIYDKNSNLSQLRDISGQTSNYSYDAIGRLTGVNRGIESARYSYNQDNTVSTIEYGNAVAINYDYDNLMNISGIKALNENQEEVFKNTYNYDKNGNRIETIEDDESTKYTYDALQRLKKVEYPDYTEEFVYDKSGNRIEKIKNGESTTYLYDIRNRLTKKIEDNIETKYIYDNQGNLKEEVEEDKKVTYFYDGFNRTKRVTKDNKYQENFYDAEGLRYKLDENGEVSKFIFNGTKVISELDENSNVKDSILRGHEIISKKDDKNDVYYYISNAHGDVTRLLDNEGRIKNSYIYDAFGNVRNGVEEVTNRFKYSGEQFDITTGQYYLRARFYNPVIGRFTQEDTYRGDGLNLYAYVKNNPIRYVDPSGYVCKEKYNAYKEIRNEHPNWTAEEALEELNRRNNEYVIFNRTHIGAQPSPRPRYSGPNGGSPQSHHGLQDGWADANLSQYGYDRELAPTITIENGNGRVQGRSDPYPHTIISREQNIRRNNRRNSGQGRWSSTLQEELQYIVDDLTLAGFSNRTVRRVLDQTYSMLDNLGVTYTRINVR